MNEDFLAVVETKRFLGQEFLTWLVHRVGGSAVRVSRSRATSSRSTSATGSSWPAARWIA